jgi:hypothetical protein
VPEGLDRGTADRRAQWVAVRTLRQRAVVVGETEQGTTIYEVQSARLVLPPGASHFKRLTPCAKCGGDAVGSAILNVADLERPAQAVYCGRCGRSQLRPSAALRQSAAEENPMEAPAEPAVGEGSGPPTRATDAHLLTAVVASVGRI